MRHPGAFFYPAARPAILLLMMLLLPSAMVVLWCMQQPEYPFPPVDAGTLGALIYSGIMGFMAGASVREVQHCRFVWVLPGMRQDARAGFLLAALGSSSVVAVLVWLAHPEHRLWVLASLGMLAFCLGAVLTDPRSGYRSFLHHALAIVLLSQVNRLARMSHEVPALVSALALAAAGLLVARLFSTASYREAPSRLFEPLPGAFSLRDSRELQRRKAASRGAVQGMPVPGSRGWGQERWLRAALMETFGGRPMRSLGGDLRALWPLAALFLIHAAADRGDLTLWDSLMRSVYHSVMMPDHLPPFGEKPPYVMVSLVVAAMGGMLTFARTAPFSSRILYPISRRALAGVVFAAGMVEGACVILVIAGLFGIMGVAAGWAAGFDLRLDHMPHFLRAVVATGVLLPAVQGARLKTQSRGGTRAPETVVLLIIGVTALVVAVSIWSFLSPALLPSAGLELSVSLILLVVSQVLFWSWLRRYYGREDLA